MFFPWHGRSGDLRWPRGGRYSEGREGGCVERRVVGLKDGGEEVVSLPEPEGPKIIGGIAAEGVGPVDDAGWLSRVAKQNVFGQHVAVEEEGRAGVGSGERSFFEIARGQRVQVRVEACAELRQFLKRFLAVVGEVVSKVLGPDRPGRILSVHAREELPESNGGLGLRGGWQGAVGGRTAGQFPITGEVVGEPVGRLPDMLVVRSRKRKARAHDLEQRNLPQQRGIALAALGEAKHPHAIDFEGFEIPAFAEGLQGVGGHLRELRGESLRARWRGREVGLCSRGGQSRWDYSTRGRPKKKKTPAPASRAGAGAPLRYPLSGQRPLVSEDAGGHVNMRASATGPPRRSPNKPRALS